MVPINRRLSQNWLPPLVSLILWMPLITIQACKIGQIVSVKSGTPPRANTKQPKNKNKKTNRSIFFVTERLMHDFFLRRSFFFSVTYRYVHVSVSLLFMFTEMYIHVVAFDGELGHSITRNRGKLHPIWMHDIRMLC